MQAEPHPSQFPSVRESGVGVNAGGGCAVRVLFPVWRCYGPCRLQDIGLRAPRSVCEDPVSIQRRGHRGTLIWWAANSGRFDEDYLANPIASRCDCFPCPPCACCLSSCSEREPRRGFVGGARVSRVARSSFRRADQCVCRDSQAGHYPTNHLQRQAPFPVQNFRNSCTTPNHWLQVLPGQALLFHTKLNCYDRVGSFH